MLAIYRYVLEMRGSRQARQRSKAWPPRRIILALLVAGGLGLMGGLPPLSAQGALDMLQIPLGLSARFAFIPPENPLTAAKVALGQPRSRRSCTPGRRQSTGPG